MHRLYVLMPDAESCKRVVDELKATDTPERHLHVVASLAQDLAGLPEASVWQRTELAHGIEWGIGLGGVAGLIGGVLAVAFPPAGLVLGGGALLLGVAAGAGVGGVVSALLGSHEHSHSLEHFQRQIGSGRLLLLVDVPRQRVEETRGLIQRHHPDADIGVAEPKS
jgi:hypothetical protein